MRFNVRIDPLHGFHWLKWLNAIVKNLLIAQGIAAIITPDNRQPADDIKFNGKDSALANLTLDIDTSSHLIDDLLADAKSKPCASLIVFLIFLKSLKVYKKIFDALLWNAFSLILDLDREPYQGLIIV